MHIDFNNASVVSNILYSIGVLVAALIASAALSRGFTIMSHRFQKAAFRSSSLRQVIFYSLLLVAALVILNRFGFDTHTIMAVIGTILGIFAIGFVAVWSVLSNFLCTLIILALKPFHTGDEVSVPGENVDGRVIEISLTFTLLERADGSIASVPNNLFFQKTFIRKPRA